MEILSLFAKYEQGGRLIECALVVALITLISIAAITTVGTKTSTDFSSIDSKL